MKSSIALIALLAAAGTSVYGAVAVAPLVAPNVATVADNIPAADLFAENDHDDEGWFFSRGEDEDDDDEDDYSCQTGQNGCAPDRNPTPATNAAPPANGLFAPGAAPSVKVN